ncbi:MAG: dihydrodipicolinate synthase family protein [Pirellulales bacterium]
MQNVNLISAVGTPLNADETVHLESLERLLSMQWDAGIDGVLVAGTMGLLQLLRDETYTSLIEHSVRLCNGNGELLIGVGDAGFARTADRIRYVNRFSVDGVVAVTPYLVRFRQEELLDYYRALADISKAPLFLYDLPSFTGVKLDVGTVVELSTHSNIAGIKCSGDLNDALELIGSVDPSFRVIVAKADQVDALCAQGVVNHLDGVFSLAPEWTREIAIAAECGDWIAAATAQRLLNGLLGLLHEYGVFPAYNELMHVRNVPGLFAPKPFHLLDEAKRQALLNNSLSNALKQSSRRGRPVDGVHIGDGRASAAADGKQSRSKKKTQAI